MHVTSQRTYLGIFLALIVLTAATVLAAFVDLGFLNAVVALGIAVAKGLLVILFFMHVRYSSRLTWIFVGAGFFWLGILFALGMSDYLSRGWLPYPGR